MKDHFDVTVLGNNGEEWAGLLLAHITDEGVSFEVYVGDALVVAESETAQDIVERLQELDLNNYVDLETIAILQAAQGLYQEQPALAVRKYDVVGSGNPAKNYANDLITHARDQGWWEHWEAWEWSVFRNELVRLGLEDLEVDDDD
jgi:hypothetical protein